jgi:hypothetical protein
VNPRTTHYGYIGYTLLQIVSGRRWVEVAQKVTYCRKAGNCTGRAIQGENRYNTVSVEVITAKV